MVPAAFLDDDSHKLGNKLQGIRIYDPGALRELKASGKIDALIISSSKISRDRQNDTLAVCGQLGIPVRVFGVTFEEVSQPATDVRIESERIHKFRRAFRSNHRLVNGPNHRHGRRQPENNHLSGQRASHGE